MARSHRHVETISDDELAEKIAQHAPRAIVAAEAAADDDDSSSSASGSTMLLAATASSEGAAAHSPVKRPPSKNRRDKHTTRRRTPPVDTKPSSPSPPPDEASEKRAYNLVSFTALECVQRAASPTLRQLVYVAAAALGVALALHARFVWCRAQPALVVALVVCGAYARPTYAEVCAWRRSSCTAFFATYTQSHALRATAAYVDQRGVDGARESDLLVAWHAVPLALAAWVAYGALFHAGKHAVHDLALVDGVMLGDTRSDWASATFLVPTARVLACLAVTAYTTHARAARRATDTVRAFAAYAALAILPPVSGIPHTLSVYHILVRVFCFVTAFHAFELARLLRVHWFWARVIASFSVTPAYTKMVSCEYRVSRDVARRDVNVLRFPETPHATPHDVLAYEVSRSSLPGGHVTLSVVQAAWLLTTPDVVSAVLGAVACLALVVHATRHAPSPFAHSDV